METERREDGARQSGSENPETAGDAAERVADDIRAAAEAQRTRAADGAQHAANSAHQAADNLRGQEAWMAGLIEQGADKLADLAQVLRSNDLATLLARSEQFARRQPVLFTGAAMALGFALTRVVSAAQQTGTATAPSSADREAPYGH
jgi:hypothetical protein